MSRLQSVAVILALILFAGCGDSVEGLSETDPTTSVATAAGPSASTEEISALVHDPELDLPAGFVLTDSLENTSNDTRAIDLRNLDAGLQPWGEDTWRQAKLIPDGERLLVFPYHTGPLLVDRQGNVIAQVSEDRLNCPMITRTGAEVLYIPGEGEPGERRLHRIDLTEQTGSDGFTVAVGDNQFPPHTDCPVEVGGRLATTQGGGEIVLSDLDGSDPEVIYDECAAVTYPVSPDDNILPFIANCSPSISSSGLFEYDTRTGETRHVIHGLVGAPAYSPDGGWVVFSYNLSGDEDAWEYWIATSDGRSARRLGEDRFFPTFVPG